MYPLTFRIRHLSLLLVLAAQLHCEELAGHIDEALSKDESTCPNASDSISLLQVNADKKPIQAEKVGVEQLADVEIGVLSKSIMVLDRSDATTYDSEVWQSVSPEDEPVHMHHLKWVFGAYHKTGCGLTLKLIKSLGGKCSLNRVRTALKGQNGPRKAFDNEAFSNFYFSPQLDIVFKVPEFRFVHMIRMPAELLVSAYHWHWMSEENEYWLATPMRSRWCLTPEHETADGVCADPSIFGVLPRILNDPTEFHERVQPEHRSILRTFNESVNRGETLNHFFRTASKSDGMVVEAYRALYTLSLMAENYERTRQDDRVVQVRMESIKDEFHRTMSCMFSFLQQSHNFDMDWAMKNTEHLNVAKYGDKAAGKAKHINDMSSEDLELLLHAAEDIAFVPRVKEQLLQPSSHDCLRPS